MCEQYLQIYREKFWSLSIEFDQAVRRIFQECVYNYSRVRYPAELA